MKVLKNRVINQLTIASFTIMMLSSCAAKQFTESSTTPTAQSIPEVETASQISSPSPEPQAIAFEVCSHLPDWERPSLEVQTTELSNHPRYSSSWQDEPLRSLFDQFWHGSAIAFTTYGLSARMEPTYLSGTWTAITAMEQCYSGDTPDSINQGELAELWLIGHIAQDLQWSGEGYEVTLKPTLTGLQVVQFARLETRATLPIQAFKPDGVAIPVIPGDYSP